MLTTGLVAVEKALPAAALNGSSFDPGNIISDSRFYDGDAMTEAQIQSFLTARGSALRSFNGEVESRGHETSSKTGNLICSAFQGGASLPASTIIYRTQQACGISAKVILVTLQKEQGLINKSTAAKSALDRAMGYACPDTAPCAAYALGFGNQVFMGARQMKIYKAATFAKQPGVHTIAWHPNPACGASTFTIKNYATAALYNYTPYRPNAAALANYPGTGNSCSSYGNRNFWFFYNDWFGSSITIPPADAIKLLYAEMGGSSGVLGVAVTTPACNASTPCVWTYEGGAISWMKQTGAVAVTGTIATSWLANRSKFGHPIKPQSSITDPNGDGTVQTFERGVIHSSSLGTFLVTAETMPSYLSGGWLRGSLGWPTSAPICGGTANACLQTFQGGMVSMTPSGAGTFMRADVANVYRDAGAQTGALGFPMSTQTTVTDPNGNGVVQAFETGMIHASEAGAFVIPSAVMKVFSAAGWVRGKLGWPTSGYLCDATRCIQTFSGGTVRTAVDGRAASVVPDMDPAVLDAYTLAGGQAGTLGYPLVQSTVVLDKHGNGVVQSFEGGIIHAGPSGAYAIPSAIMSVYSANGWVRGRLGWPTSSATCDNLGCNQSFSGGTIVIPTGQSGFVTAAVVNRDIRALYESTVGTPHPFGLPISAHSTVTDPNGNGVAQTFQNGVVHASAAGTYFVPTAVMSVHSQRGWVRGSLGWPAAAAVCDANGCLQQFQRGTIDTH